MFKIAESTHIEQDAPVSATPQGRGVTRWGRASALLALALAALASTPALFAAEIITGPVDKAGFQAVVDAAGEGDTIRCLPGVYDFDDAGAVLLTRSVTIRADDPADPPVFQGLLNGPGPAGGGLPLTGNTAFAVPGGTEADGIALEGVRLTGFNRAVVLYDGFDDQQAGCPAVSERLTDVRFAGNTVDNSNRGLQVTGGPHARLSIENNQMTVNAHAVLVLGGGFNCLDPMGGIRRVDDTERVFGLTVSDNVLVAGGYGILALHTKNATIRDNQISAGSVGIDIAAYSPGGENGTVHIAQVTGNVINGGFAGIVAELQGDPSLDLSAQVRDNSVEDSFWGVYLAPGVNGIKIKDTAFSGVVEFEAVLDQDSHDNELELLAGERAVDLGSDNKIKFE